MACRWSKTSGSSKLSCSWSTRSASATCRIFKQCICRRIPPRHWLQPHSQTVDVGEHHHRQFPVALAVANMHSSRTRTNQVLSFQPPRTYEFFGIYWDLNFQQGFVWGLHQSSDLSNRALWHLKNKDMASDLGWLLPFECKHEQKANRPSAVHAPKEKPLPRDPKITLQMSAAGWTPLTTAKPHNLCFSDEGCVAHWPQPLFAVSWQRSAHPPWYKAKALDLEGHDWIFPSATVAGMHQVEHYVNVITVVWWGKNQTNTWCGMI